MIHFLSSMIISSSSAWNFAILFLSFSAFFLLPSLLSLSLSHSPPLRVFSHYPSLVLQPKACIRFVKLQSMFWKSLFFPFVEKCIKMSSPVLSLGARNKIIFLFLHSTFPSLNSPFLSFSLFYLFIYFLFLNVIGLHYFPSLTFRLSSRWNAFGKLLSPLCLLHWPSPQLGFALFRFGCHCSSQSLQDLNIVWAFYENCFRLKCFQQTTFKLTFRSSTLFLVNHPNRENKHVVTNIRRRRWTSLVSISSSASTLPFTFIDLRSLWILDHSVI